MAAGVFAACEPTAVSHPLIGGWWLTDCPLPIFQRRLAVKRWQFGGSPSLSKCFFLGGVITGIYVCTIMDRTPTF